VLAAAANTASSSSSSTVLYVNARHGRSCTQQLAGSRGLRASQTRTIACSCAPWNGSRGCICSCSRLFCSNFGRKPTSALASCFLFKKFVWFSSSVAKRYLLQMSVVKIPLGFNEALFPHFYYSCFSESHIPKKPLTGINYCHPISILNYGAYEITKSDGTYMSKFLIYNFCSKI
jgi:hypothetical protein